MLEGEMGCFTHYWEGDTCQYLLEHGWEGKPLEHTSGKLFSRRGIAIGDKIYIVNILHGVLYLIGRLEIGQIVFSSAGAKKILGYKVEDAPEHLIAKPGTATPMRFKREVPQRIIKELLFHSGNVFRSLTFVTENTLDRQTLRGVRRLAEPSAKLLEQFLP